MDKPLPMPLALLVAAFEVWMAAARTPPKHEPEVIAAKEPAARMKEGHHSLDNSGSFLGSDVAKGPRSNNRV